MVSAMYFFFNLKINVLNYILEIMLGQDEKDLIYQRKVNLNFY